MKHILCSLFIVLLSTVSATAQSQREAGLELVLLADGSGSIDAEELAFQRQGYALAMTDPRIIKAIEQSIYGNIAVTYVEWAVNTYVVVDWTMIDSLETAEGFANALMDADTTRRVYGGNAIGGALLEGLRLIETNDIFSPRAVIDFSGDSVNNSQDHR